MNGDCDDAGTLAMLHTLQDLGECNILAITTSWGGEVVPGAIDAINTYYGHPDIPTFRLEGASGGTARRMPDTSIPCPFDSITFGYHEVLEQSGSGGWGKKITETFAFEFLPDQASPVGKEIDT